MRTFLILPLSAIMLSGCLTTQENPNYEYSTTYKGDQPGQNQYAAVEQPAAPVTMATISYDSPEAQQIMMHTASTSTSTHTAAEAMTTAPTDTLYGGQDVTGTPGFMAMQSAGQSASIQSAVPASPTVGTPSALAYGTTGTPVDYDYSRNTIAIDAVATQQKFPESVGVLPTAGQNYTVQQGDTVYSLARKTCVGINVIQSMNGLNSDFAIQIGQSLRLPQSVC